MGDDWRRYAGPAAFLLAVTIAVLLVRSGLQHHGPAASTAPPAAATTVSITGTPTTTAAHKPKKRYWTVRAGDTFAVIAAKSGVPEATIEQLNPRVKSTSLFIGEKLRIQ